MKDTEEALVEAVVQRVLEKQQLPPARLIGRPPQENLGWRYAQEGPYDAVVIGSMTAAQLLAFPDEVCCQALLEGKPVYLWEEGLEWRHHSATANRALWSKLLACQRNLRQLGVQFLRPETGTILTAEEVRRRLRTGQRLTGRLTPLARELLETMQCKSDG